MDERRKKEVTPQQDFLAAKTDMICPEAKSWMLYSPIVTQIIVDQDFDIANI